MADDKRNMPIVARCPACKRGYIWTPKDGGTCLWCRVKLVVASPEGEGEAVGN